MTLVVIANVALIVAATTTGVVAARRRRSVDDTWPAFWFAVAAVGLVMAVGQAVDLGDLLADIGRRQARSSGWYQTRSVFQAAAIAAAIVGTTAMLVVGGIRRRSRLALYAPTALLTAALVAYSAIRVVSLHDVDRVLNTLGPADVRLADLVEFVLLVATTATVLTQLFRVVRRPPADAAVSAPEPDHGDAPFRPR